MTYRELYESAINKLEKSEITLGEFERMIKPLNAKVATDINVGDKDTISRKAAIDGKICIQRSNGVEIYDDYVVPVEYLEQLPPAQPAHDTKVALSLLVDRFENVLSEIREINGDDTVCKWCEYNGAYIGQSGNWDNVCTGFDKENCFKLKDSYRKELESIDG